MTGRIRRIRIFINSYEGMPADFAADGEGQWAAWRPDRWNRSNTSIGFRDLLDQHQPDLLYTDGAIPFDELWLEPGGA